jgi:arylsulfatase A-like enzyme
MLTVGNPILGTATGSNALAALGPTLSSADSSRRSGMLRSQGFTTPNINHIAVEGTRFTQAYANSAVCTASRVALITGRYQYRLAVGLDVGGVTRGKERHGFGDFIRRSEPLHRDRREQALVDLLDRFFG